MAKPPVSQEMKKGNQSSKTAEPHPGRMPWELYQELVDTLEALSDSELLESLNRDLTAPTRKTRRPA